MPDQFLSISESRRLTGKSESTIKRMVREIVADRDNPDRTLIKPGHDEVGRLRAAGERYTWGIAEELLLRRFSVDSSHQITAEVPSGQTVTSDKLLEILRDQLTKKDQHIQTLEKQLDRKDTQIANLSERQRETNILMKNLQERLAIETPKKKVPLLSRLLGK